MVQERAIGPDPIPPTTQRVPRALGEARAVAPQVGSSVYLASVVCLLCILILISSPRDLILVGKRHTPYALVKDAVKEAGRRATWKLVLIGDRKNPVVCRSPNFRGGWSVTVVNFTSFDPIITFNRLV